MRHDTCMRVCHKHFTCAENWKILIEIKSKIRFHPILFCFIVRRDAVSFFQRIFGKEIIFNSVRSSADESVLRYHFKKFENFRKIWWTEVLFVGSLVPLVSDFGGFKACACTFFFLAHKVFRTLRMWRKNILTEPCVRFYRFKMLQC